VAGTIDLNSDLGEGFGPWPMGDDDAMLRIVSSANIACGAHAGDASIMRRRCDAATRLGVRIGAHVGYRDLAGFGRRRIDVPASVVEDETLHQIGALGAAALAAGDRVRYVKPHGMLYHDAARDPQIAFAIVSAARLLDADLVILGMPGTELESAARESGLAFAAEGFVDRRYRDDGALVDRSEPDAVLDGDEAVEQGLRLAGVPVDGGGSASARFRSLCVHGDSPDAVEMARELRRRLTDARVQVAAFS
jgi:UPF0271 protein